jgi:uncharacterized protein
MALPNQAHMLKSVVGWSSLGLVCTSMLMGPIEWLKNTFLFHPSRDIVNSPAAYGLPYEEVWFGGPDNRTLHGWYIPSRRTLSQTAEPLFLWFHGNGGNISHRLSHLALLYTRVGGSHFMFDYQGYGKSRGKPTIPGILADGREAITLVQSRGWARDKRLVYFGESLGTAVVIALAIEHRPDQAILLAPFYSLRAMARLVVPPLAFLVDDDLNSARLIARLRAPLLVIHGTEDGTVPFEQGQDLYDMAPQPKRFHVAPGAGHANVHEVGGEPYIQAMRDFVFSAELGK